MPSATSCAEPASTPTWSSVRASRVTPVRGIVPKLGFMPQTPQKAAGRTTEPAVWVPRASGTPPAATVAAEPEDEPPGVRESACGLRVAFAAPQASSVVTVLPRISAPAARRRRTTVASAPGLRPSSSGVPFSVGWSAVSMMSLMATGTPANAPHGPASSIARACASASAASRWCHAWTAASVAAMRPKAAAQAADALSRPARTAAATSAALGQSGKTGVDSFPSGASSSCPHRCVPPLVHPIRPGCGALAWQAMRAPL